MRCLSSTLRLHRLKSDNIHYVKSTSIPHSCPRSVGSGTKVPFSTGIDPLAVCTSIGSWRLSTVTLAALAVASDNATVVAPLSLGIDHVTPLIVTRE